MQARPTPLPATSGTSLFPATAMGVRQQTVYQAVTERVGSLLGKFGDSARLTFHLSPGTPAMSAVWIIVAKTRYGAELIESSKQQGVRAANVPFDISAEFIPEIYRRADRDLTRLSAGIPQEAPEYSDIVHRSPVMRRVVEKAQEEE